VATLKKSTARRTHPADDLDRSIRRRNAVSADYAVLVEAALDRRRLMRALAIERERQHIPQQAVARRMKTSQPAVARIESGEIDVRLSTVERYAAAIGKRVRYQLAG
jgi:ribosome-binding protein aMBF1 (putative translation factor)